MEQITFPIPEVCEYLTEETKQRVYHTIERDEQGSKVSDFFACAEDMFSEMKWQKKLRCNDMTSRDPIIQSIFSANPLLFWFSSHMVLWSSITFNFAVLMNLLVAFFYPFGERARGEPMTSCPEGFARLRGRRWKSYPWRPRCICAAERFRFRTPAFQRP